MDDNQRAYIAGTGTITALGNNPELNYHAVKAGISGFKSVDYFTRQRQRISMALVPEEALPALKDELNIRGKISFRYRRILRMCHVAATQALQEYRGKSPVPLIFAGPANDFGLPDPIPENFVNCIIEQTGLPVDAEASRLVFTGRNGVLDALDLALGYLYESGYEYVLIGGADSYQKSDLVSALDRQGRILASGNADGFVPGEGAGFVLLSNNPATAIHSGYYIPSLLKPGLANEPGHWFSDEAYRGDGLAQAFERALGERTGVGTIYSSMNGENYWAKEYAVAMTRNRQCFADDYAIQHPADCYGDLGAATGAVLINLAVSATLKDDQDGTSLIYCSSDQGFRGACCFEPIPISGENKVTGHEPVSA